MLICLDGKFINFDLISELIIESILVFIKKLEETSYTQCLGRKT